MTQHRNLAYGDRLPESLLDALQELLGTYVSKDFKLTLSGSTMVQALSGTGNDQDCLALMGRWRFNSATVSVVHPGGGAGTYDVWAVASENSFAPSVPEVDNTNYGFTLRIVASGGNPVTGSGATAIGRKVGELAWDGAAITSLSTFPEASDLSDGTVTTPKIAAGAVTAAKIAAGVLPQAGTVALTGMDPFGATECDVAVVFGTAYASPPTVVVGFADPSAHGISAWAVSVTTTGFTLRGIYSGGGGSPQTATGTWIARGA